jgi:hypothetical protein
MERSQEPTRGAEPDSRLRQASLLANVAGAVGATGFLLHARQHPPKLLLMIFVVWVLSPYAALSVASFLSQRWTSGTRTALYGVMILIALGTLTIYGADAVWPRKAQPAFVFVLVPPVAGLIAITVVGVAGYLSRRR